MHDSLLMVLVPGGEIRRSTIDNITKTLDKLIHSSICLADLGELVENIIGDQAAHSIPFAFLGETIEFQLQIPPAMDGEHGLVGWGRSVKGNLFTNSLFSGVDSSSVRPVTTNPG